MAEFPQQGRLDLHCHILPGIDDGCRTLDQSLECVRAWQQAGFVGSVCTPHVGTTWYPDNTPDVIFGWVVDLRRELRRAGIDYALWAGAELRLSERVMAWMQRWGVPTLANGRSVLIDWWGNDWPHFCDDAIDYLLEQGYQPILAHPERMGLSGEELKALSERLVAKGVLLQGNFNSLSGGEGENALRLSQDWLSQSSYYFLASDTHEPNSVPGRLAGLTSALESIGAEAVAELTETRTRAILSGTATSVP